MKQGILIVTHPDNTCFFDNLILSIAGYDKYPVRVHRNDKTNDTFELGALKSCLKETDWDEILLLQDSCEIKDARLFDEVFEKNAGKSVAIGYKFLHYLGKYRREILEKMEIPDTPNKEASIFFESKFNNDYMALETELVTISNSLHHSSLFEQKCGRLNMKLENEFLIKWKGTWSIAQLNNSNNRVVDIIIITMLSSEFEKNCIDSVRKHTNYPSAITIHENKKRESLSVVWNRLIQESRAEYICLLNSDTVVEADWLRKLMQYFNPSVGAIGPVTDYGGEQRMERGRGIIETDTLSGFCLLFPKRVWEEIGGFDEQFELYFEDADFCRRIKDKGYKLLIAKDIFIHHEGQATIKEINPQWREQYKKSEELFRKKHP